MAEEVLSLLKLEGNERILDIGCGNGKTTAEIAARVPQGSVTGVDASAEMIAFAKDHWISAHPNLQFAVADARKLPFDHEFDLITSFNALHWIPDQALPLQAIHAALRPEGRAQLRLVSKGERKSLEDVIQGTSHSPRWAAYFEGFHDPYLHLTPQQYAALAEQNGLHVLACRTADKAWDFQSRANFLAFSKVTMVEWTQHVPEAERPLSSRMSSIATSTSPRRLPETRMSSASTRWISSSLRSRELTPRIPRTKAAGST